MAADVNLIKIAAEGLEEGERRLYEVIFGSQGIKLPKPPKAGEGPKLASSESVRSFLLAEGARNEAVRKATGRARAKGAPEPGQPPPRRSRPPKGAK